MNINGLPDLCFDKIFCFLDSETLVSCYNVSKRWRKLINFMPRSREILIRSIDVGAEFKNLPLDKLTRAKIGTFRKLDDAEWVLSSHPCRDYDFTLFRYFTRLTHLELDADLSFESSEAVRRLRDTLSSLSLGPNVRRERWVNFWKDNARLDKLEIVSNDVLDLDDLPKTLKAFAAVHVNVRCLQPCRESLTYLKVSGYASGSVIKAWSFDRLKKLILGSSDQLPESAPVIEYFEYRDLRKDYSFVKRFLEICRSTLTDVLAPGLNFDYPLPQFPNLKNLTIGTPCFDSCEVPALKRFTVLRYNPQKYLEQSFPETASEIESLSVRETMDYLRFIFQGFADRRFPDMYTGEKILAETLITFLKTLCRLKSFEIKRSYLMYHYLESVPLSNLKRLRILDVLESNVDLSRFAIELDELKITTIYGGLTVKLPSTGSIKDLILEGNVMFVENGQLARIEGLTWDSFLFIDLNFLRRCLKRGLTRLRIDRSSWATECPDSFFETLKDSNLFAIYASVHQDLRKDFECKIKRFCPSVRICSFACSRK